MTSPPADERDVLDHRLDVQRAEVAALLDDLDEDAARARLVPSATTLLGLVKHATFVEGVWFHSRVAGVDRSELGLPETVEESFVLAPDDTVATVRTTHLEACERSRRLATTRSLDEVFPWHGVSVSLRLVYGHLIAELARHAGHGDILREQLAADAAGSGRTH